MFHRAKDEGVKPQGQEDKAQGVSEQEISQAPSSSSYMSSNSMTQTAVKRHTIPQDAGANEEMSANQNATKPMAVATQNIEETHKLIKEEVKPMNNPDQNNKTPQSTTQPQARVDIPGNNFQRPGQQPTAPQNAAQASRPSYPGTPSYPGAASAPVSPNTNTGTYGQQANDADTTSKLNIGKGITLSGEIEACDHLVVEGTVEAALKGANILEIAESGAFFGTVEIEEATIAGRFEGDITVKGRLNILSTGTIIGSISYKELSMEAGATLDGSVSPIGSQNSSSRQSSSKTMKAKKVSQSSGAELPFSDRAAAE